MPLWLALTTNSIFIASSTAMLWPTATASPSATSRLTTTPVLGVANGRLPGGASCAGSALWLAVCAAAKK